MNQVNNRKKFGYWSIVLLAINGIIGTGIFLTPQGVIRQAGSYTPLVYLLAALFAGVLAVTFASAAKYVSKNGAAYAYTKAAFGDKAGLYIGLTRFFSSAIAWGVMATAVVKTTLNIFIGAENVNNTYLTIGFIVLMSILFLINMFGNKIVEIISNVSTIGKLAALVIAIVAGAYIVIFTGENHFSEVNSLLPDLELNFSTFVGAVIAAFYAFTGFESVASAVSEMENPEENLPKAIPVAITIIAAIYIGIVSIGMMLNPGEMLNSKEVVVLAATFSNSIIKNIIVYGALISMFGINVAASFSTPKVFQAMANEGQLPRNLGEINEKGVPVKAFLVTVLVAILIPMVFAYDTNDIMVISAMSRFTQFLIIPIAVMFFYFERAAIKTDINAKAKKNYLTDIIIPALALIATIVLLAKFNWVGQFSVTTEAGLIPNWYAIGAMVVGFLLFPLIVIYNQKNTTRINGSNLN